MEHTPRQLPLLRYRRLRQQTPGLWQGRLLSVDCVCDIRDCLTQSHQYCSRSLLLRLPAGQRRGRKTNMHQAPVHV